MKKIFAYVLALCMIFALCACGEQPAPAEAEPQDAPEAETAEEPAEEHWAGMPNPMTQHSSLEEINNAVGATLCAPEGFKIENESFWTIDCGDYSIAQYDFSMDGMGVCFRCAPVMEDISGCYVGEGTAFPNAPGNETEFVAIDNAKLARWFNVNGQFVFNLTDNGAWTEEDFEAFIEELKWSTVSVAGPAEAAELYASLAGDYQDSWSQRAMATVEAEEDCIIISIHWSDSAASYAQWDMTCTLGEDGLLYYTDCVETYHVFDADGSETVEEVEYPAEGWFAPGENGLAWTGAGDEYEQQCVFEKMPG